MFLFELHPLAFLHELRDARTNQSSNHDLYALLLMEFQLGYEHHGELLLFGPIMRCILNLEEQAQHGS